MREAHHLHARETEFNATLYAFGKDNGLPIGARASSAKPSKETARAVYASAGDKYNEGYAYCQHGGIGAKAEQLAAMDAICNVRQSYPIRVLGKLQFQMGHRYAVNRSLKEGNYGKRSTAGNGPEDYALLRLCCHTIVDDPKYEPTSLVAAVVAAALKKEPEEPPAAAAPTAPAVAALAAAPAVAALAVLMAASSSDEEGGGGAVGGGVVTFRDRGTRVVNVPAKSVHAYVESLPAVGHYLRWPGATFRTGTMLLGPDGPIHSNWQTMLADQARRAIAESLLGRPWEEQVQRKRGGD
jgi:hypothetical protein